VDLEDEVCHPQGGTTCLRGHVPARRCDPSLVSNRRHARPAFVPRATGRRQETSETARATNLQVRNRIRVSPQVAKPGSRTLSRWRHGFEPRWDCQRKRILGVLVSTLVKVQTRTFRPHQSAGQARRPGWAAFLSSAFVPLTTSQRHKGAVRARRDRRRGIPRPHLHACGAGPCIIPLTIQVSRHPRNARTWSEGAQASSGSGAHSLTQCR
jgi:hypothetical protein